MALAAFCLSVVLAILGCSSKKSEALNLPESLPGGWTRGATRELPAETAPAEIRALGVTRAIEVEYSGPHRLRVVVYVMGSPTGAFEAAQKWRHQEGSTAFHEGRYLAVIEAPQISRDQRDAAADAVSKSLR